MAVDDHPLRKRSAILTLSKRKKMTIVERKDESD